MFLISEVRLYTSWLRMVSKLMEGLQGTSSMLANVEGAATFFTSTPAGVFGSGWPSDAVKTSGAGAGSDFGSSSCALSVETQRKTVTVISNLLST